MQQQPGTYIPSVSKVAAAIFEGIEGTQPPRTFTDEQLVSLHFLFDKTLGKALKILDQGGNVLCFTATRSRRRIFVVQGKAKADSYVVFPEHYCSCKAFQFDVVGKNEAALCKHQLAARIGDLLGKCEYREVPDHTLSNMLMS